MKGDIWFILLKNGQFCAAYRNRMSALRNAHAKIKADPKANFSLEDCSVDSVEDITDLKKLVSYFDQE